jgi:hypothetical protein
VCGCLLRTAVARLGCCTPLLYGMTAASKNTVKGRLTSDYQLGNCIVMLSLTRMLRVTNHVR